MTVRGTVFPHREIASGKLAENREAIFTRHESLPWTISIYRYKNEQWDIDIFENW